MVTGLRLWHSARSRVSYNPVSLTMPFSPSFLLLQLLWTSALAGEACLLVTRVECSLTDHHYYDYHLQP